MHIFYTPNISGSTYTLSEEESKHCVRVLRLKNGDRIQLVDGKGGWYNAEISDDQPKRCSVNILEYTQEESKRKWKLHIAIAPTKNMDRLEWFTEKSTETGIDEISLLECNKSERSIVKAERLEKVCIAAIKQSMTAFLPKLNEMSAFSEFIKNSAASKGQKFIAHCHARTFLPHIKTIYNKQENALVLIGPEGDFSKEEVELALANGFVEISLGSSRLRTETAAIYACVALNVLNE